MAYWQRRIFPEMREKPIRAHYEGQWWNSDPVALRRWQTGQTGFPLVDAGMRELWVTGWMAQNVRMAAAILLCEHLNIHWIEGRSFSCDYFFSNCEGQTSSVLCRPPLLFPWIAESYVSFLLLNQGCQSPKSPDCREFVATVLFSKLVSTLVTARAMVQIPCLLTDLTWVSSSLQRFTAKDVHM